VTTFDVHQHLWPAAFVDALRARAAPPVLRGSTLTTIEGTCEVDLREYSDPERRVAALDRDGIDVAVVSLQPSLGCERLAGAERDELELAWIDGTSALIRASTGRFRAFAPWRVAEGFVGTSVGPSAMLEPDAHAALLAEVDAAGGVLFVHPEPEPVEAAGRPDWWSWTVGYAGQMQRAYFAWHADGRERMPSARIVFSILAGGAPYLLERLSQRGVDVRSALDPHVYFDTASHGRRAIELCIETFGAHQLVYGSDTPVVESKFTLDAVRGFGEALTHILQIETPRALLS
jgi:predicted TIM-barrel fold metal-dependent hydrolase